jgi:hypothetical protein
MVAEASGRSPEAIRKADTRAAAKEREEEAPPRRPAPAAPAIDTGGLPLPAHMFAVESLVKRFGKVDSLLRQAQGEVTAFAELYRLRPGGRERLIRALHDAAVAIRAEEPDALCPECKGTEGVKCRTCTELGWVTQDQLDAAPREQKTVTPEEHAAGLDPEPLVMQRVMKTREELLEKYPTRERKIPPIKAGVQYGVDENGDVVPSDIDRHIARAAVAVAPAKKKRGPRVVIATEQGDHEVTEEEGRQLTVEREDDEAWTP